MLSIVTLEMLKDGRTAAIVEMEGESDSSEALVSL